MNEPAIDKIKKSDASNFAFRMGEAPQKNLGGQSIPLSDELTVSKMPGLKIFSPLMCACESGD
jgi:hypothetical protein